MKKSLFIFLLLLGSEVFALDSLSVYGNFSLVPAYGNRYDVSAGMEFYFKQHFYSNHKLFYDRFEMLHQISNIGYFNPNFRIGFALAINYAGKYLDGIKFSPGFDLFLGFKDATNLALTGTFYKSGDRDDENNITHYYSFNSQLQLGAKKLRFVLIAGAAPYGLCNGFSYQQPYSDFGRLWGMNIDLVLGFRSNSFYNSQIGLLFYNPMLFHKLPVSIPDYDIWSTGALVELKKEIIPSYTLIAYIGYLFAIEDSGVGADTGVFDSIVLKIGCTKKVF